MSAQSTSPSRAADRPEPLSDAFWHRRVAEEQGLLTNQICRVVFIGDSLTDFWTHYGLDTWETKMAPLKAGNIGIAGDRTEHILWRIEHLDFHRAKPEVFVLLMGTNNLGMVPPDPPEAIIRAQKKAIADLFRQFPQSRILLLEIPPNGFDPDSYYRQGAIATNALMRKTPWPERVKLVPLYADFVDEAGHWKPGLTVDGLHFGADGYALLGKILEGPLKEALGAEK